MDYKEQVRSARSSCEVSTKPNIKNFQSNALKQIQGKRTKVIQFSNIERQKIDLYWKLAFKLENQLKVIKSHNTPEAREKLILLEKCRNQRHIRRKTRKIQSSQIKLNFQSNPHQRPKTCCPRGPKSSQFKIMQGSFYSKAQNKQNNRMPLKYLRNIENIANKLDEIKLKCIREHSRSQELKQDFNTIYFYQKLIAKNSSKIFTKML